MNGEEEESECTEEWIEEDSQEQDLFAERGRPLPLETLPLESNHRYLWEPREGTDRNTNNIVIDIPMKETTEDRWDDTHFLMAMRARTCDRLVLGCQDAFNQTSATEIEEEDEDVREQ